MSLVSADGYEYKSEFAKRFIREGRKEGREKGREEGREEGLAEGLEKGQARSILVILEERRLDVSDAQREAILSTGDLATLDRWLRLSVSVPSVKQLLESVPPPIPPIPSRET